jgi:hypothetical protein
LLRVAAVRIEKLVNEAGSSSGTQRKWNARRENLIAEAGDSSGTQRKKNFRC